MASTSAKTKVSAAPTKKATQAPVKASRSATKSAAPIPAKPTAKKAVPPAPTKADKKKEKAEKVKVVRDSFTIPKTEYAQIAAMKKRAVELGLEVKKSELLRAGLALLSTTSEAAFRKALGNVPTLKTGRPGKA